jgi:hypothetical protein
VIPAGELEKYLQGRRAAVPAVAGGHGQRQVPGHGQAAPDLLEVLAPLAWVFSAGDRVLPQQAAQGVLEPAKRCGVLGG